MALFQFFCPFLERPTAAHSSGFMGPCQSGRRGVRLSFKVVAWVSCMLDPLVMVPSLVHRVAGPFVDLLLQRPV
jgi:hypothetical protein